MQKLIYLFAVGALVCGCVSNTENVKLDYGSFINQPLPPKSNDTEIILISKDLDKSYKEIGIISAVGKSRHISYEELNEKMKKKAREVGADAIIKIEYGTEARNVMVPSTYGYGSFGSTIYRPSCKGIVVVFVDKK